MPRSIRIGLDPILTLAAIGLCVASLVTLGGISHAQMVRQGGYLGVGAVDDGDPVALRLLAPARAEVGPLRDHDRLDPGRARDRARASAGISTRSIGISVFSFQASELGKVLLIVFMAALRRRQLAQDDSSRQLVARVMLLALDPDDARDRRARPRLGARLRGGGLRGALHRRGRDWQHLAAVFALGVAALALVLIVGPLIGFHPYQAERLTAFLDPGVGPREGRSPMRSTSSRSR